MKVSINESRIQRESNQRVKQWLWRYHDAKLKVTRLSMECQELVSAQWSIQAINYDKLNVQSGTNTADLSNLVITKDACISRLLRAKEDMVKAYTSIASAIADLNFETERAVISMRYIQLTESCAPKEWCEIAQALGYSETHVQRIHGIALEKLAVIIPKHVSQC